MIIRAITKSKKKVVDRYTVYFYDCSCLTLSSAPDSHQGVSQLGEYFGINDADFEEGADDKKHNIHGTDEILINWFDLPSIVQSHIEKRISGAGENHSL